MKTNQPIGTYHIIPQRSPVPTWVTTMVYGFCAGFIAGYLMKILASVGCS